jgi:hypothetical protein
MVGELISPWRQVWTPEARPTSSGYVTKLP